MNSLVILPHEISDDVNVTIEGSRAQEVFRNHTLDIGSTISVAVLHGKRGMGYVCSASKERIILTVDLTDPPLALNDITLIIAVPRPQTQKKILHLATVLGVKSVHFIRSAYTDKSYLQSHNLREEAIQKTLIKGLEQCKNSLVPKVTVFNQFKRYIEDTLCPLLKKESEKILFHTDATSQKLNALSLKSKTPTYLAIGAESGWNEYEVERFTEFGFQTVTLGDRILRVETATAVALGQISLLKNL